MLAAAGAAVRKLACTLAALAVGAGAACGSSADAGPVDAGSFEAGTIEAGPGDGAPADAMPTPFTDAAMRAAATAFNTKFCPAFAMCDPLLFEFLYGTIDECLAAGGNMEVATWINGTAERYVAELTSPYANGSLLTPDALLACAAALDFSTCDAFVAYRFEGVVPDACRTTVYGSLPVGSPCRLWNQCKSGRCNGPGNGACGRCVDTQVLGGPCAGDYFACPPGAVCVQDGTSTTCKAYRGLGEPCDPSTPCHQNLACAAGICARPPADGSCDPATGCPLSFVYCNPATKKCEPVPLAKLGEPCAQPNDPSAGCARGGTCLPVPETPSDAGTADGGPTVPQFVCMPLIEDGQACGYYIDFPCKRPDSVCYRGICQQNGPAECSPPPVLP